MKQIFALLITLTISLNIYAQDKTTTYKFNSAHHRIYENYKISQDKPIHYGDYMVRIYNDNRIIVAGQIPNKNSDDEYSILFDLKINRIDTPANRDFNGWVIEASYIVGAKDPNNSLGLGSLETVAWFTYDEDADTISLKIPVTEQNNLNEDPVEVKGSYNELVYGNSEN